MSNTPYEPVALAADFDISLALPAWTMNAARTQLTRDFVFKNFTQAFEFMTLAAEYAEELNHHPDWSNSWNKVRVSLSTHSLKMLSSLDISLAKAMDQFCETVLRS
jgi:4a-hydroxytetrahydrobiopterin dehydratase